MLLGPEDFISHGERDSLFQAAEASQGRGLLELSCESGAASDKRNALEK